jgi:putative Mn2+ efflux pump MntP
MGRGGESREHLARLIVSLNVPELVFGAFLVAFGAIAFWLAGDLSVGTAGAMGPGYVPRALAILIMLFGVTFAARAAVASGVRFPEIEVRPLLLICASVALFALLLPRVGLAITSFVVVVSAGYAAQDVRARENLVIGVVLAAFAVALFIKLLGLPISIGPN